MLIADYFIGRGGGGGASHTPLEPNLTTIIHASISGIRKILANLEVMANITHVHSKQTLVTVKPTHPLLRW